MALTTTQDRARIFGEIRVLKALKHKNVMSLYDWWYDNNNQNICFITELFTDGSLRQYRRKHRNADLIVMKRWAWQILQGLVYLHAHNPPIIHRDLKSDNIFVNGSSGTVKIGDLGFATMRAGLSVAMSVIGECMQVCSLYSSLYAGISQLRWWCEVWRISGDGVQHAFSDMVQASPCRHARIHGTRAVRGVIQREGRCVLFWNVPVGASHTRVSIL
mmetsp:Transcript_30896/g.91879  ORF Transcript_30896/g.91879 Transcript_30896/m.91879 type:complete len:217 (-) Transcript_30896:2501-3151(-)